MVRTGRNFFITPPPSQSLCGTTIPTTKPIYFLPEIVFSVNAKLTQIANFPGEATYDLSVDDGDLNHLWPAAGAFNAVLSRLIFT